MILIALSNKIFENDVFPLVRSFYPEEVVKVKSMEEIKAVAGDYELLLGAQAEIILYIETKDNQIGMAMSDKMLSWTEFEQQYILSTQHHQIRESVSFEREKSSYKNSLKRFLYELLSQKTRYQLPWGILTGIRPTKLVYDLLEKDVEEDEIFAHMEREYLCSKEKIETSLQIARRELELLREMDYKNGYSLYIGIPFCPTTCAYCSFTSYPLERFSHMVEGYLKALEKEINYAATCMPGKKLTTVYFGGGTPTTLEAEQLDWLLGLIREKFDFTYVREFCVEAGRPDSITREKLEVLKKWGVDRISINPQTMQQRTLDLIGRKHTVEQIVEAFHLARECGHSNINMDLILGLPGEHPEDVEDTLKQIETLNPESITIHTLAIKRAAKLNMEKEEFKDYRATDVSKMLKATTAFAKKQDYVPYYLYRQKNMADNLENIGYSKIGHEGLYNILIMEEQQTILALGAGAMSKFVFYDENRLERVDNVKSIVDYIGRIDEMIQRKVDFLQENGLV